MKDPRKQALDIKKTFMKYCIVGWGVPIAIVALCVTLDYIAAFEFGYGLYFQKIKNAQFLIGRILYR